MSPGRQDVDAAVLTMLAAATDKEIYDIRVPANPTLPYAIVYPLDSPPPTGSFGNPVEDHEFIYQVTCVGGDHRQTAWMSDAVFDAMVERGVGGYATSLSVSSDRFVEARGSIVPSGEQLFEVADTYRVRTGA